MLHVHRPHWATFGVNIPLTCLNSCVLNCVPHISPIEVLWVLCRIACLILKQKLGVSTKSHKLSDMRLSRHPLIIATASSLILIKKLISSYRPCRTQLPGFQPELITVCYSNWTVFISCSHLLYSTLEPLDVVPQRHPHTHTHTEHTKLIKDWRENSCLQKMQRPASYMRVFNSSNIPMTV